MSFTVPTSCHRFGSEGQRTNLNHVGEPDDPVPTQRQLFQRKRHVGSQAKAVG